MNHADDSSLPASDPVAYSTDPLDSERSSQAEVALVEGEALSSLAPPPKPQPVAPSERIAAVDVVRGVALLGILTMNIVYFAWPFAGYTNPHHSGGNELPNQIAWLVNTIFFDGKMMSLFSMLFGAGLVLMGQRAEERGAKITGVYYRRIFWLLVIGLVHAYLIWGGDILVPYALCGLLLYLFRRLSARTLIVLGVLVLLISIGVMASFSIAGQYFQATAAEVEQMRAAGQTPEEWQVQLAKSWQGMREWFDPEPEAVQREIAIYRDGYFGIVAHRAQQNIFVHTFGFVMMALWMVGGRMLLGMGLMKLGVFTAQRSWRFYGLLALFAYGIGLPLTIFGAVNLMAHDYNAVNGALGSTAHYAGTVPMALGHAAVVMMICKAGALPWLTAPLAAVGRMALTNYLMQSILCTTFFYGYGLGWFGYMDRVQLWGVVIVIWILQLIISPIWLANFRYGPAEWLWRSLTYWKLQPMRYSAA